MAELHLGFVVKNNQTVTKIGKKKEVARVRFRNEDPTQDMTLDIWEVALKRPKKPRKGRKLRSYHFILHPYVLDPQHNDLYFSVENFAVDSTWKYKAQIDGSAAEDPIIIIEK